MRLVVTVVRVWFETRAAACLCSGRYPWHLGQQTGMNLNPTPGIACGIDTSSYQSC